MPIKFEIFQPHHLDEMKMRAHERFLIDSVGEDILFNTLHEGYTAYQDGEIMACFGVFDQGGVWLVPSEGLNAARCGMIKSARRYTERFLDAFGLLYSVCQDDALHNRWMRFLGFKRIDGMPYGYARFERGARTWA